MYSFRRLLVFIFVCCLAGLAACGGSNTTHTGNSAGNSSPTGSTSSKSAGATGLCTLLSKSQIQQIFGFPVGFSNFTDPQAQSATDTSALCIYASALSANDMVTMGGDISTTPDGAKQAYTLQSGVGDCSQAISGLGDEACADYNATTSAYEINVLKGNTAFFITRTSATHDASIPGKLQQAARVVLAGVH